MACHLLWARLLSRAQAVKSKTSRRLEEVYFSPAKRNLTLGLPASYLENMEKASLAENKISSKHSSNGEEKNSSRGFQEGDKVEAYYKGRSKLYPGRITRVRGDGTYDIDYDDGEKESRVREDLIRSIGGRSSILTSTKSDFSESKVSFGGSYDRSFSSNAFEEWSFPRGSRVACYWYRPSDFGAPRVVSTPKPAIVLNFNSDGTYSVEIEDSGSRIEDVLPKYLKQWNDSSNDEIRKVDSTDRDFNCFSAVESMAKEFLSNGKSKHKPIGWRDSKAHSEAEVLKLLLGDETLEDFQRVFEKYDDNGEIDPESMLKAFKSLGGDATIEDLKAYSVRKYRKRFQKYYSFEGFVIAYANIFFANLGVRLEGRSSTIGKTLGLEPKWSDLASFSHKFGKKLLNDLERAFDTFAVKGSSGGMGMPASKILEAFHRVGRAITVSKLKEWMADVEVYPEDAISLADFISVYDFFFGKPDTWKERTTVHDTPLTISEIALIVLQEEPWQGTRIDHDKLLRRLSHGRSSKVIEMLSNVRDIFEEMDTSSRGVINFSDIPPLLKKLKISPASVEYSVRICAEKAGKSNTHTFALPEVFVHFGSILTDIAESSISVAEAFAMFRLHSSSTEIRVAADLVCRILDNILQKQDPKYWQVNLNSEVSFLET